MKMNRYNGGLMTANEWQMICHVCKEEKRLAKPLTDEQKKQQAERERLELVYKRNKRLGYHATVYVDPDNNARRRASSYLSKIMPTTKCAARDGNPIANIFKGARQVEQVDEYSRADLSKRYEAN
jgi:hypothetical protein